MKMRLAEIAHARSGDKADWVDFGLFAWNAALSDAELAKCRAEPRVGWWPVDP